MPAKSKKTSKLAKLNVFANSPKVVKVFGPLLIVLIVGALGYGGYILISERSSDAASRYGPWHFNSSGISHKAGQVVKNPANLLGGSTGAKGPVWYASANSGARDKHVWNGPGVKLPAGRQYLGCFFYQANSDGEASQWAHTFLNVYNRTSKKILNHYSASGFYNKDHIHLTGQTVSKGKFGRTCLAFHIPKSQKNNRIALRVKLFSGSVMIKKTKITHVPQKKTDLPNLWLLKNKGNKDTRTILHGFKYN